MLPTLLYSFDNPVGHLLAGNVNHETHPVAPSKNRGCRLVIVGVCEHLGGDRPELHERGTDRQPTQVRPQSRREMAERRLGCRVAHEAGHDAAAGHRGDVDDVAAAASQHPGNDLSAQLGRGEVVDLGDLAQVVVGRVGEGSGAPDAGVVHQNVNRPGFFFNPTDEVADLDRIREIGGVRGAPKLGRERPNGVLGAGDERDRGPRPGEGVSERLADAARRPGNQHSFSA